MPRDHNPERDVVMGRGAAMDWRFLVTQGPVLAVFVLLFAWKVSFFIDSPDLLFVDGRLYFQATEAWLNGGNPWAVQARGVPFAGPPTTLLLNLPLVPFGEDVAWAFWPIAGVVGIWSVLRRLNLPAWWLLFPPVIEGWVPGSPDMALAGLAVGGGAWIAALTKPYAMPAVLAERGWKPILIAAGIVVLTLPLLPWGTFLESVPMVQDTLTRSTLHLSAWGNPLGMVAVSVALLMLGRRMGLGLVVPALWPNAQSHYSVFSMYAASRSPVLAIGLSLPVQGLAPLSVIAYALWLALPGLPATLARGRRSRQGQRM
jgi:hypothetical protein